MSVRSGSSRCENGHDLTLPGAIYVRPCGKEECRKCRREAARVRRKRKWRTSAKPPMRKRGPTEPQMTPAEIDAYFAKMTAEENAAQAWQKPRRMWPDERDRHSRLR